MDRTQVRHRAHRIIVSRISDPTFGVEQLADELHFGRRQLHRYFHPGPSPHHVIMYVRLHTAALMIAADPDKPLSDVASATGFLAFSWFRENFRCCFGVTPTRFREAHRRCAAGRASPAAMQGERTVTLGR